MVKITLITLFFTILCYAGICQNLLPNPGFELHKACPSTVSQIDSCYDWIGVENSADYFHACCGNNYASVPFNYTSSQYTHSGCAYTGIFTYHAALPNYREFFQGQLNSVLIPGTKYYFSFYINLADMYGAPVAGTKIGFKLSTMPFTIGNDSSPAINNQATFMTDSIITDTINWTNIKGSLIADSAYQYLTFGNFFDDLNTQYVIVQGVPGNIKSYYNIDDVCFSPDSLSCITISDTCWPTQPVGIIESYKGTLKFSPNPVRDILTINMNYNDNYEVSIYDVMGKCVLKKAFKFNTQINAHTLCQGLYICEVRNKGSFRAKFKFFKE